MKFLTLEKEAFGLDISDLSLKIIKLKKRGELFSLVSSYEMEIKAGIIEKGVVQDEDALAKIIKVACKEVVGEKLNTKYVIASLPEEKSFLQVIQMPKMDETELKSAILFEAENYIPLPMSEVYLDFQTIRPIKDHLNHLDVLIVAMPKKIVNSYVASIKKAGLIPIALEVESEAIVRALVKNETSNSPMVLIDFGRNSTDFIIFAGRSIQFTCSIPVSSEQLTVAISTSLEIDLKKAERLKIKYTLSDINNNARSKKILEAMNPILNDLVAQIKKYLNFYQDHTSHEHISSDERIQKILMCGGGANLAGLPKLLSEKLGIPVELSDFWINFSPTRKNKHMYQNYLSFATALGLALRGIKDNT